VHLDHQCMFPCVYNYTYVPLVINALLSKFTVLNSQESNVLPIFASVPKILILNASK
jgi:hypothetical protein